MPGQIEDLQRAKTTTWLASGQAKEDVLDGYSYVHCRMDELL